MGDTRPLKTYCWHCTNGCRFDFRQHSIPYFFEKMSEIDKEKLASILQELYVGEEKSFNELYWELCLEEIPNLNKLYLNDIGNISIPISQKVCLPFICICEIFLRLIVTPLKGYGNHYKSSWPNCWG